MGVTAGLILIAAGAVLALAGTDANADTVGVVLIGFGAVALLASLILWAGGKLRPRLTRDNHR